MNLLEPMELAGRCLLAWLDPEKDFLPTGGWEVAHDTGRWWDAALRLEAAGDFEIPAELGKAMLQNIQRLTDNVDGLLMNRADIPWMAERALVNPHNFREAFMAFTALVTYRANDWAREAGHRLVETLDRCLTEAGTCDYTRLRVSSRGIMPATECARGDWLDCTASTGRCIEALVRCFEATGDEMALDVARRFAEYHLRNSIADDGSVRREIVDPENVGHDHSCLGTLRGLLLYGLVTGRDEYVDAVAATYRTGVRGSIVHESGWAPHDLGKTRFPNQHGDPVADPASAGDAAQLALWLALRAGHVDLLDDVDRIVRARLLPAQLAEKDVRANPEATIGPRQFGGWGIHGPTHGGKGCILDVHAAVVHTLCDIHGSACTQTPTETRVNLHVNHEDDDVKVACHRDGVGHLSVLVKRPRTVAIRVPGWAPSDSIQTCIDGEPVPVASSDAFLVISGDAVRERSEITVTYGLPERTVEETMPSGRSYRIAWRGDEIVGVSPPDEPMPFYPELDAVGSNNTN